MFIIRGLYFLAVFFILCGIFIGDVSIILCAIGLIGCGLCFSWIRSELHKENKKNLMYSFAEKCIEKKLDISSITDIKRMEQIAKNLGCDYNSFPNIEEYYKASIEQFKIKKEAEKEAELKAKIKKEKELEETLKKELEKYAELIGNKRITILKEKYSVVKKKYVGIKDFVTHPERYADIHKERDWAVQGGIANAIAGPVAGAMVASDTARKNAEIRERNAHAYKQMNDLAVKNFDRYFEVSRDFRTIEEALESTQTKLFDIEMNQKELFEKLEIEITNLGVTISGACKLSVCIEQTKSIRLFDEVDAVVDGTISAELFQNDKLIGKALLVLPIDGTQKLCIVEGICTEKFDQKIPVTVKYKPYHLWAMEKQDLTKVKEIIEKYK